MTEYEDKSFVKQNESITDNVYGIVKENENHECFLLDAKLNNILTGTATELCMCANNNNNISSSLSKLQAILLALTKHIYITDIQCATRMISAAFHVGVIVYSSPKLVPSSSCELSVKQSAMT